MALYNASANVLVPSGNRPLRDAMIYKIQEYIAGLVVNYGISNTTVLEIP